MLCDPQGKLTHIRHEYFVSCLVDHFIKHQDQCRQESDTADHADDNPLRHNDTNVASQCKGHTTQSQEACHCGDGACRDGLERIGNRMGHGPLIISREPFLVGLVAVQQENGVVHRHAQLQHCGQRLCDIGNISQESIASHIIYDRHADAEKEQQRNNKGIHRQRQYTEGKDRCDDNVDRKLLQTQVLDIRYHAAHAAGEALFAGHLSDLSDGLHRFIRRSGIIK